MLAAFIVTFHLCSMATPSLCADQTKQLRQRPPMCGAHYEVDSSELNQLRPDAPVGPTKVDVICK